MTWKERLLTILKSQRFWINLSLFFAVNIGVNNLIYAAIQNYYLSVVRGPAEITNRSGMGLGGVFLFILFWATLEFVGVIGGVGLFLLNRKKLGWGLSMGIVVGGLAFAILVFYSA